MVLLAALWEDLLLSLYNEWLVFKDLVNLRIALGKINHNAVFDNILRHAAFCNSSLGESCDSDILKLIWISRHVGSEYKGKVCATVRPHAIELSNLCVENVRPRISNASVVNDFMRWFPSVRSFSLRGSLTEADWLAIMKSFGSSLSQIKELSISAFGVAGNLQIIGNIVEALLRHLLEVVNPHLETLKLSVIKYETLIKICPYLSYLKHLVIDVVRFRYRTDLLLANLKWLSSLESVEIYDTTDAYLQVVEPFSFHRAVAESWTTPFLKRIICKIAHCSYESLPLILGKYAATLETLHFNNFQWSKHASHLSIYCPLIDSTSQAFIDTIQMLPPLKSVEFVATGGLIAYDTLRSAFSNHIPSITELSVRVYASARLSQAMQILTEFQPANLTSLSIGDDPRLYLSDWVGVPNTSDVLGLLLQTLIPFASKLNVFQLFLRYKTYELRLLLLDPPQNGKLTF